MEHSTGRWYRSNLARITARHWFDATTVLVALTLYSVAWPTLHLTHVVPMPMQPLIAALAAGPLLLIRLNPALGWAISAGSALLITLAIPHQPHNDLPFQVVHVLCLIALLFAVAVRSPTQLVVVAFVATALLFATTMPGSGDSVTDTAWGWPIGLAAVVLFALLVRWLVLSRRELVRQEEETEVERARRAILEEKARIARDLHDVIAHHMSLVVVQAQTAAYRVEGITPAAEAEFASIGATARSALNEIRGMLGVLRSDGQLVEHAPQPMAADVLELLAGARRAGVPITWTVAATLDSIAATTGLALYRILQESLSNASRHAAGAEVRVEISATDELLRLRVCNGAPVTQVASKSDTFGAVERTSDDAEHGSVDRVPRAAGYDSGGHGIAGMRARALAVGGGVDVGPIVAGGFEVRAWLPLAHPAEPNTALLGTDSNPVDVRSSQVAGATGGEC